jgi:hypothetical protein
MEPRYLCVGSPRARSPFCVLEYARAELFLGNDFMGGALFQGSALVLCSSEPLYHRRRISNFAPPRQVNSREPDTDFDSSADPLHHGLSLSQSTASRHSGGRHHGSHCDGRILFSPRCGRSLIPLCPGAGQRPFANPRGISAPDRHSQARVPYSVHLGER